MGDIAASAILLAVSVALTLATVLPVHSFIRGDWPAQFFPVYSYLGERLRAFDIPGWNPYQFSGAPFAGDPESGWMYLPAMVIYALLPAEPATAVYIGLHIAFAGLALYFFARLLGLSVVGSLIGGASFAFAWVAPASMHMIIFFPVAIWLVVALAGVELAVRAGSWARRLWSWLLAAFAISQILAIWLGQGAYYALLVVGGWIAYRTLLFPAQPFPPRGRLLSFLLTSLAVFGIGFGLSAPGMLPRLSMVEQSSLAGGIYNVASAWEEAQIGFSPAEFLHEVLGGYSGTLWWYTGAVAMALAFMAPVIARRWQPMLFFVSVGVCSFILSLADRTPLHNALYAILPRFEGLHAHSPERVVIVFIPAIALLAAATVSFLSAMGPLVCGIGGNSACSGRTHSGPLGLTGRKRSAPFARSDDYDLRFERAGCVFHAYQTCAHSIGCADRTGLSDALGSGRPHRLSRIRRGSSAGAVTPGLTRRGQRLIPSREWSGVISRSAISQPAWKICWL